MAVNYNWDLYCSDDVWHTGTGTVAPAGSCVPYGGPALSTILQAIRMNEAPGAANTVAVSDGTDTIYKPLTNADQATMSANTVKGNAMAGAAVPQDVTVAGGQILTTNGTNLQSTSGGAVGEFLTFQGAAAVPIWSAAGGSGTVTSVGTGTGLTGGPITGAGTIDLANTAVVPATYNYATLTVDQQGRLTAASSASVTAFSVLANVNAGAGLPAALPMAVNTLVARQAGNVTALAVVQGDLVTNTTNIATLPAPAAVDSNPQFLMSNGVGASLSYGLPLEFYYLYYDAGVSGMGPLPPAVPSLWARRGINRLESSVTTTPSVALVLPIDVTYNFTMQPGRYYMRATAPAYRTGGGCRIRLVTTLAPTVTVALGATGYTNTAGSTAAVSNVRLILEHVLTVGVATTYQIMQFTTLDGTGFAFGRPSGMAGFNEIYTTIQILKLQ